MQRFLSPDGKSIVLSGIALSEEFRHYSVAECELQRVDVSSLSPSDKLAFFINVYNLLVIHGLVNYGPPTSYLQRAAFFSKS